jgi:hypothetical protein
MNKDEALKLARRALYFAHDDGYRNELSQEAIAAIKAALKEKDEPVAWAMLHDNGHFIDAIHPNEHARVEGEYITPLYTTPPQRTWVGLTNEEVTWLCNTAKSHEQTWGMFVRAIETKLRSKNDSHR